LNVADVAPAGIVTVAGTRAREGASLWSATTSADAVDVFRVTVPVVAGFAAFSAIDAAASETVNRATSSSVEVTDAIAPWNPGAVAVIVAVWLPSAIASSIAAIVNVAEEAPDGIVTIAGTEATPGALDESDTTRSVAVLPLRLIVAVAADAPAFSANVVCESVIKSAEATLVAPVAMPVLLPVDVS